MYGRCLGGCTSGPVPIGMLFVWSMSGWVYFRACTYRHVVCMVDVWVGAHHWACCLNAWSMSVQVYSGVFIDRHNTVCLNGGCVQVYSGVFIDRHNTVCLNGGCVCTERGETANCYHF